MNSEHLEILEHCLHSNHGVFKIVSYVHLAVQIRPTLIERNRNSIFLETVQVIEFIVKFAHAYNLCQSVKYVNEGKQNGGQHLVELSIHLEESDSAFDVFSVQQMQAFNYLRFIICFYLLLHQIFTNPNVIENSR